MSPQAKAHADTVWKAWATGDLLTIKQDHQSLNEFCQRLKSNYFLSGQGGPCPQACGRGSPWVDHQIGHRKKLLAIIISLLSSRNVGQTLSIGLKTSANGKKNKLGV